MMLCTKHQLRVRRGRRRALRTVFGSAAALFCILASDIACPAEFDDAAQERIEQHIAAVMEADNVPSFAVAIVHGRQTVYAQAFGFMNLKEQKPATIDTLYNIGSVTKTFTATLLMILRDAGRLDLDDEVSRFLPETVELPKDAEGRVATLRHLAKHTSGLPTDPPNRNRAKRAGYNVADLYRDLKTVKLASPVGQQWSYSNLGYGLLGHALERTGGSTYEELLKQLIFAPLGMDDSSISLEPDDRQRFAAHYWADLRIRREMRPWTWGEIAANGGITSTVTDMAKYVAFQLTEQDHETLPVSLASLREVRGQPLDPQPGAVQQCLGWMASHTKQRGLWYEHGGEVDGQSSYVAFSPPLGAGFVVLSNLGGTTTTELARWMQQELHSSFSTNGED